MDIIDKCYLGVCLIGGVTGFIAGVICADKCLSREKLPLMTNIKDLVANGLFFGSLGFMFAGVLPVVLPIRGVEYLYKKIAKN